MAEFKKKDEQKKTVYIISIIGAILIGAGIFSFIASNWSSMGKSIKILIIIAAMLIFYGVGWYVREKKALLRTGMSLIFLGTITYGAGIFLIAQMFHLRVSWADGYILWMIGTVVVAHAFFSPFLFYVSLLLGVAALGELAMPGGIIWTPTILLLTGSIVSFRTGLLIHKKNNEATREVR